MSAEKFSFDTTINFILDGGLNGYLKIQGMELKLSLQSLDVSNNRLKNLVKTFFLFFSLTIYYFSCYVLTVIVAYKVSNLYRRFSKTF